MARSRGRASEERAGLITPGQFGDLSGIIQSNLMVAINRSQPFNPAQFLGEGWSIWKGPADGDGLTGEEEQDERSLQLTELDLSKVKLVTCLKEGESVIDGEEKLKRLMVTKHIRLDAKIFQTFWEKKIVFPRAGKRRRTAKSPSSSLMALSFAVRVVSAAFFTSAGAAASGAGTMTGLSSTGTTSVLRPCLRHSFLNLLSTLSPATKIVAGVFCFWEREEMG